MIQIENITLLNKNNLAGENKLEVLKNYGLQCELTDLAIITGAIDRDIFRLIARSGIFFDNSKITSVRE